MSSSLLTGPLPKLRFQHLKVYPRKRLRRDPATRLPIPHADIRVKDFAPSRWQDHYNHSLVDNLMYMTYVHELRPRSPRKVPRLKYDPADPFTKNRNNPLVGGNRFFLTKPLPPDTPDNIIKLNKIQLHIFDRSAINSRSNLLGPIMALRALSGETEHGAGLQSSSGVRITRGKSIVSTWGIRPGMPVGAVVEIKGQAMWDFIGTLTEFVLPRIRDFTGFKMALPSSSLHALHAVSGVVSVGLDRTAMGFFPQIEVNQDAYPRMYGMYIHFHTSAKGVNAQNRARALLSGLQIPFIRR